MRRRVLLGLLALSRCGLSERPYTEKREWPLVVGRDPVRPPRRGGRILLVRDIRAAPGMDRRGLQWLQPDGSVRTDFYEEWAVAPAASVESDLRRWLAASGLFAAVIAPGSRLTADLVLEGVLTAVLADIPRGVARLALTLVLIDQRRGQAKILMQQDFVSEQPLRPPDPPAFAQAVRAGLADVLAQAEAAIGRSVLSRAGV